MSGEKRDTCMLVIQNHLKQRQVPTALYCNILLERQRRKHKARLPDVQHWVLHTGCVRIVESGTRGLKTIGFGFLLLLLILEVGIYFLDVDPGSTKLLVNLPSKIFHGNCLKLLLHCIITAAPDQIFLPAKWDTLTRQAKWFI